MRFGEWTSREILRVVPRLPSKNANFAQLGVEQWLTGWKTPGWRFDPQTEDRDPVAHLKATTSTQVNPLPSSNSEWYVSEDLKISPYGVNWLIKGPLSLLIAYFKPPNITVTRAVKLAAFYFLSVTEFSINLSRILVLVPERLCGLKRYISFSRSSAYNSRRSLRHWQWKVRSVGENREKAARRYQPVGTRRLLHDFRYTRAASDIRTIWVMSISLVPEQLFQSQSFTTTL